MSAALSTSKREIFPPLKTIVWCVVFAALWFRLLGHYFSLVPWAVLLTRGSIALCNSL